MYDIDKLLQSVSCPSDMNKPIHLFYNPQQENIFYLI
jgi:hypothetical protein